MALDIEIIDYSKKTFNRPKYFVWTPGEHVVRILDVKIPRKSVYWFGNGYVQALGEDDPQALLNKRIRLENPENYKNVRGYRSFSDRYAVNVLDRTVSKICPNCDADVKATNGTFPAVCPSCNSTAVVNVEPAPLNRVRVMQGGKTLFDQIKTKDDTIRDEEGNPRGVQNFDLKLIVVGTGNQRMTVATETTSYDEIEISPENLFDTETIFPKVTYEEMEQLVRGVSLRDIFAARRSTDLTEVSTESTAVGQEESVEERQARAKKSVDELFA
jgi:hypothetical protein